MCDTLTGVIICGIGIILLAMYWTPKASQADIFNDQRRKATEAILATERRLNQMQEGVQLSRSLERMALYDAQRREEAAIAGLRAIMVTYEWSADQQDAVINALYEGL